MHQTFDVSLGINLLHANQHLADDNRSHFDQWGITCLNIMSSPGAGKTVLLEKTLEAFKFRVKICGHRRRYDHRIRCRTIASI